MQAEEPVEALQSGSPPGPAQEVQQASPTRSTGSPQRAASSGLRGQHASEGGAVDAVASSAVLSVPATTTESSLASAYSSAVPGALTAAASHAAAEERSTLTAAPSAVPSESHPGGEAPAGDAPSTASPRAASNLASKPAATASSGGAGPAAAAAAERHGGEGAAAAPVPRSHSAAGVAPGTSAASLAIMPVRAQVQVVEAATDRRLSPPHERVLSPQAHRVTASPGSRSGSSHSARRHTPPRPTSVEGQGYRNSAAMPELAVVGATAATALPPGSSGPASRAASASAHDERVAERSPERITPRSPTSPLVISHVERGVSHGGGSHAHPHAHAHPHFHPHTKVHESHDTRPSSPDSESSTVEVSHNTSAVNRSGPLIMPFAERRGLLTSTGGDGQSSPALSPPPSVGRRPPNHGSVRLGPAHIAPLPGSPNPIPAAAPGAGPGPGASSAARSAAATQRPDAGPTGESPAERSALQRIPTRDRDRARAGHAAGGGAAAVKAAAAAAAATGSGSFKGDPTAAAKAAANAAAAAFAAGGKAQSSLAAGGSSKAQNSSLSGAGSSGKVSAGAASDIKDPKLQQLTEVMQIKSIHKAGIAPGLDPPSMSMSAGAGQAGVPGRRGRRIAAHPSTAAANAAATAAYFAGLEAAIAAGTAGGKALLPSGLARRLREARTMAGPPAFQRRRERQPPPSPSGVKLDGFMLLEAADEEMPEAVQAASLESRLITDVESADLSYFVALRDLDVSDNKLPDVACLMPLQALVRLRAASCRLRTLGRWPGNGSEGTTEGSAPGNESIGGGASSAATPSKSASAAAGVSKRQRAKTVASETVAASDSVAAALEAIGGAAGSAPSVPPAAAAAVAAAAATASGGVGTPTGSFSAGHVSFAASIAAANGSQTPEPSEAAMAGMQAGGALMLAPMIPNPFRLLEVLDLSYNQLQAHMVLLPGSPIALLPRLVELDLSANRLRVLPSPTEILTAAAAAAVSSVTGDGGSSSGGGPLVAFPALRRLRLSRNCLKGAALASLAALAPPCLVHLDLSHNAISEAPPLHMHLLARPANRYQTSSSLLPQPSEQQLQELLGAVLPRLAVVDMTYNRVAAEAAVGAVLQLPALQRLLLAGNPLATTAQRAHLRPADAAAAAAFSSKMDFGAPEGTAPRPTVAGSLTARFARIAEEPPKQQASTLAAAAAAAITSSAAPERVTEAFDRMDATIEQWRLNTVVEEDEEDEDEGDDGAEDRTFLTGVGIQERRRRGGRPDSATDAGEDGLETVVEDADQEADLDSAPPPSSSHRGFAPAADDRPLWESIADPTERLAVALGLDPLGLPMHTGALTSDSAGAISALRFALAHPLVEADDGLAPHPRYATTTTAAQLKRKPRRPVASQRLAPMATAVAAAAAADTAAAAAAAGASPRVAKIQTVEAMLEGMKGKLAALEASLTAHLATAPAPAPAEAAQKSVAARKGGRYSGRRVGGSDTDSEDGDDSGSTGSGLPDDVIDQIERESESDLETEGTLEDEAGPLDPMQGIVLLAEQIVGDDQTLGSRSGATSVAGTLAPSVSQSPTIGLVSSQPSRSVMGVPITPQSHAPSPTRGSGSPQRGGVSSGGAGGRKGGPATQVPTTPVALPNAAASALGYAV